MNPINGISRFSVPQVVKQIYLGGSEIDAKLESMKLIDVLKLRDLTMLHFYAETHVEISELATILISDFSMQRKKVKIRKTKIGVDRTILLSEELTKSISTLLPEIVGNWPSCIYLFPNMHGLQLSRVSTRQRIHMAFNIVTGEKPLVHSTLNPYGRRSERALKISELYKLWDYVVNLPKLNLLMLRDICFVVCHKSLEITVTELHNLKINDLSFKAGMLQIRSQFEIKSRLVIPKQLKSMLRTYVRYRLLKWHSSPYLFPTDSGGRFVGYGLFTIRTDEIFDLMESLGYSVRMAGLIPKDLVGQIRKKINFFVFRRLKEVAVVECIYGSGIKTTELTNLEMNDFSATDETIRIRKSGRPTRIVPLPRKAVGAIKKFQTVRNQRWPGIKISIS